MKFNLSIWLTLVLALAALTFAQKPEPAKTEPAKAAAKLPTVKEILERYVKALGGRDAYEKVKSRLMTGTVEFQPMGMKGTFESYSAPDAKAYTKTVLAGVGEFIEVMDGKSAWSINPLQGSREKAGPELAQTKLLNSFYRDIDLDKLYPKLEVKGIENVDGKDAYILAASAEGVPAETLYFDVKTGLLVRSDSTILSPEGNTAATTYYDENRTVDGILIPTKMRTRTPQLSIVMTVTDIKHNITVNSTKFAKPK